MGERERERDMGTSISRHTHMMHKQKLAHILNNTMDLETYQRPGKLLFLLLLLLLLFHVLWNYPPYLLILIHKIPVQLSKTCRHTHTLTHNK